VTDDSESTTTPDSDSGSAAEPVTAVGHTLIGAGLIAFSALLLTSDSLDDEPFAFILMLVCGALGLTALLTAAIATGLKLGLKS
jgi:hypothetical protein